MLRSDDWSAQHVPADADATDHDRTADDHDRLTVTISLNT
jgi:hypothetical protein